MFQLFQPFAGSAYKTATILKGFQRKMILTAEERGLTFEDFYSRE